MTPPIWLDEFGRRRPVRPCPRCGREISVLRMRVEDVRRVGWQLYTPAQYVEWCGHGQEVIPMPDPDGWCLLVPVLGEAS
jgi:hypothetical protein